ncbi:hypothetical protein GW891_00565 [bacterium]|nr:hypothetical protein [bacterium]
MLVSCFSHKNISFLLFETELKAVNSISSQIFQSQYFHLSHLNINQSSQDFKFGIFSSACSSFKANLLLTSIL